MDVKNHITEEVLLAYLHGSLSDAEREAVNVWYESAPENAALLDSLYEAYTLDRAIQCREAADTEVSFRNLKAQIQSRQRASVFSSARKRYTRILGRISAAAAIVAAIVLSSVHVSKLVERLEQPLIVRTDIGERVQVELPDGSLVWLNACSEVAYGSRMFSSERSVSIKGEVYFDIKRIDDAPFVVHCEQMDIRVLGTKFNVQANDDDDCITTTLLEGSIQVTSPILQNKKGVVMQPDQKLVFNKKNGAAQLSMTSQSRESRSWIDGRFFFHKESFGEIAKSLERNYNISIIFKDDRIRQKQFICEFDSSDNIHRILSIMQLTGKFEYKIQGRQVEIRSL